MKPNQIRLSILLGFIIIVSVLRVWLATEPSFFWANFTPVGAMALFGGAYFTRTKAFAFPLLALIIGDVFIYLLANDGAYPFFYEGMIWTYIAFALMVVIGQWFLQKKSVGNFLFSAFAVVFVHWIVTDLGVWLSGTMYPMTLAGFAQCLINALPFEDNLLFGTLLYGTIMFGAFEWFTFRNPAYKNVETTVA